MILMTPACIVGSLWMPPSFREREREHVLFTSVIDKHVCFFTSSPRPSKLLFYTCAHFLSYDTHGINEV